LDYLNFKFIKNEKIHSNNIPIQIFWSFQSQNTEMPSSDPGYNPSQEKLLFQALFKVKYL